MDNFSVRLDHDCRYRLYYGSVNVAEFYPTADCDNVARRLGAMFDEENKEVANVNR